jgi:adenine-specific DNA methylase
MYVKTVSATLNIRDFYSEVNSKMITEEYALLVDLLEKVDLKFNGVSKKQDDLTEKIEDKIKETKKIEEYKKLCYSLPLSMI